MNAERCRECGCTDKCACVMSNGRPCFWVEPGLCSACSEITELAREVKTPEGAVAFLAKLRNNDLGSGVAALLLSFLFCLLIYRVSQ